MKENYNFEYWKENLKRLQLSVIRGTSYRYLWHEEMELISAMRRGNYAGKLQRRYGSVYAGDQNPLRERLVI